MAAIIAEWMVAKNKHLPEELYIEILSYLLPKHLLKTPEIKKYNKVIQSIPRFEGTASRPKRLFSSATNSFRTVRYIYKLNRKWKNKREQNPTPMERNTIIVYVPYTISASRRLTLYGPNGEINNHISEYFVYASQLHSSKRIAVQNKHFIERAKYGW